MRYTARRVRCLLLLVLLLAASPSRAGTVASECWSSCRRHVTDPSLRARTCPLCVTGGRVDSWVPALGAGGAEAQVALTSALKDPSWRVRWAAVRAGARSRGLTDRRALADWIMDAPSEADLGPCLTAVRAAADAGKSTADFLQDAGARGPSAAARVWKRKEGIRQALFLEMFAQEPSVRMPALLHLATFQGRSATRVVLDAVASRPVAGDEVMASLLSVVAERQRVSVGRLLLMEAKPPDEAAVNRLFAVYSREIDALRPELASGDAQRRRTAAAGLRRYGPLASRELEGALGDGDARVREHAARGLAEAGGKPLRDVALQGVKAAETAETARPWLEAMAHEKGCAAFLREVAEGRNARTPEIQGEAVAVMGDCTEGGSPMRRLTPYASSKVAPVRAGAVRALGALPRNPEALELAATALEDGEPEVVAAALDVLATYRQPSRGDDAAGLLGSDHPMVRAAAARALEFVGRAPHVRVLAERLLTDPVADVRVAAARTLTVLGGPQAVAALSEAAARDADSHVKHVSQDGLRRLGFGR
ncbi:HEAT repeat domain-containing protein [Corallococcus sp. CA047B]|uniref:HEAT repeat domain-containing protein n=1 Tax=Corallococcus sp. CA047B TaxID=2316729 RepID=UPI001F453F5F|nr:HEAT repeat domain-containing protein [Corallococcus sp. CA047B]